MRIIGLMGVLVVLATLAGGCCGDQEKTIKSLTVDNRELQKCLQDKDAELARLNERIMSLENMIKTIEAGGGDKNARLMDLQNQLASLRAAYEKLFDQYNRLAGMAATGGGSLPASTKALLRQLSEQYPGFLLFDEKSGSVRFASDVTFDLGSDQVKPKAAEALGRLAQILNAPEAQPIRIDVIGYTDNARVSKPETVARFKDNQGLSEARAVSVKTVLTQGNVAENRISNSGRGEANPIAPNDSVSNKAKNRRVEIFLKMGAGGALAPAAAPMGGAPAGGNLIP